MPTVKLNKEVFEKLVGKKLSNDKLKDRISYLGTDLEKIEGNDITVEIFPNRPDMLSEQGFARAFSSFIGIKTGLRNYYVKKSGEKVIIDKSVTMRPYTACAIVKNLKLDDERIREIMQIQEKLATTHGRGRKKSAYGLYPSNKIHFPVTYVAKDPAKVLFRPLGFNKKIRADEIEKMHPTGRAYAKIAKGWKKYPFFIDSQNNVMCMLPYTNSDDTGKINEKTDQVFIECTGNDFKNVKVALNILVTTLADMGGEIFSIDMVYPTETISTPNLEPTEWDIDIDYVNNRLGLNLKEIDIQNYLGRMGYGYKDRKVLVPSYRLDILHQADFVEDIAIAYGYENFKFTIPKVATIGHEDGEEKIINKISRLLNGLGLLEVKTYIVSNHESITSKMNFKADVVKLRNALNIEFDVVRTWIIPNLMEVLSRNKHNEYPQKIFEIGRVVKKDKSTETGIAEFNQLAIICSDNLVDFTFIKQILDYILSALGVKYQVSSVEHSSFIPGRVGRVLVGDKKIAFLGEISPVVLDNWALEKPAVAIELNITELYNLLI